MSKGFLIVGTRVMPSRRPFKQAISTIPRLLASSAEIHLFAGIVSSGSRGWGRSPSGAPEAGAATHGWTPSVLHD